MRRDELHLASRILARIVLSLTKPRPGMTDGIANDEPGQPMSAQSASTRHRHSQDKELSNPHDNRSRVPGSASVTPPFPHPSNAICTLRPFDALLRRVAAHPDAVVSPPGAHRLPYRPHPHPPPLRLLTRVRAPAARPQAVFLRPGLILTMCWLSVRTSLVNLPLGYLVR